MRPLIKMSRSFLSLGADGVVFLLCSIGKPPRPRDQRMLRDIFLIARPPLLAVMQGGDFPLDSKIFTAPVTARIPSIQHGWAVIDRSYNRADVNFFTAPQTPNNPLWE